MQTRLQMPQTAARILTIALGLGLVLSLGGCSSITNLFKEKDAYDLYTAATQNLEKADGYSMRMTINSTTTSEETTLSSTSSATISAKINQPYTAAMEMSITADKHMDENNITTTSYYKNGTMYSSTEAIKAKLKTKETISQLKNQFGTASFSRKDVIKQKSTKTAEGTAIDFTVKAAAFKSYALEQGRSSDPELPSGTPHDIKDVTVQAVIDKDGKLVSMKMNPAFSLTYSDSLINTTVGEKSEITINDIRFGHQNITAPDDLASYQDYNHLKTTLPQF